MKGCEISLNHYKHWGNWHFRCAKIGALVAVGTGYTGQLLLSVGCEPSLRDDKLFASENLHRKKRRLL